MRAAIFIGAATLALAAHAGGILTDNGLGDGILQRNKLQQQPQPAQQPAQVIVIDEQEQPGAQERPRYAVEPTPGHVNRRMRRCGSTNASTGEYYPCPRRGYIDPRTGMFIQEN